MLTLSKLAIQRWSRTSQHTWPIRLRRLWSVFLSFHLLLSSRPHQMACSHRRSNCLNSWSRHYSELISQYLNLFVYIKPKHRCELFLMIWIDHHVVFFWIQILDVIVFMQNLPSFVNSLYSIMNDFSIYIRLYCLDFIDKQLLFLSRFFKSINVVFHINNIGLHRFFILRYDRS